MTEKNRLEASGQWGIIASDARFQPVRLTLNKQ